MTNQEILTKAVEKAIAGGLTGYWKERYERCVELDELEFLFHENDESDPRLLIYNHGFAKALWSDELVHAHTWDAKGKQDWTLGWYGSSEPYELPSWQFHLQQMAVAPNPIKYLGANL